MSARRPRRRPSASSRGTACRAPTPSRCCSGCSTPGVPSSSMWGNVVSAVSGTPLKNRHSLKLPLGPPSPLAPLSDDHDDERVVDLPRLLEVVEHPSELVVVVGDVAGEHLGHAGEQPLLVGASSESHGRTVSSSGHGWPSGPVRSGFAVRVDRRQLGALGQQTQLDLALQDAGSDGLVAGVEARPGSVGPLQRDQVGGVAGLGGEVHEERLVGVDHLGVADELDRLVRPCRRPGGSRPRGGPAARSGGCRAPGPGSTSSSRRRANRRSVRSRGRAASGP